MNDDSKPNSSPSSPQATEPLKTRKSRQPSVSIKLTPEGRIDLDKMDPERREKIRFAVDGSPLSGGQDEKKISETAKQFVPFIDPLGQMIAHAEALVASKRSGVPLEKVLPCFSFTREEIKILEGPASRVIAKRAGPWLSENIEEYTLALYLLQITQVKISAFQKVLAEHREELKKKASSPTAPLGAQPDAGPLQQTGSSDEQIH